MIIEVMLMLIELQIKITSWAIVSLAGGGLAKVEVEDQAGKEKNHPSHLQASGSEMSSVCGFGEKAH